MSTITSKTSFEKYVETSGIGAIRALAGLPVEHPFDTVKTVCQAEQIPAWKATTQIWNKHKWRGFYSGVIPNGIRAAGKQAYRYPMMMGLGPFYQTLLSKEFQNPSMIETLKGLTIAMVESAVICPFERLKVYLQTNKSKEHSLRQFFQEHRNKLPSELTRGLRAVFTRQMASWVSFLVANQKCKEWEKKRIQSNSLPFSSLMLVALEVGSVNTLANMPFDTVKTHLQMKNFVNSQGVFKMMSTIYKAHGIKGLYAGWPFRMVQYMLQSVFTVSILDYLEEAWKK